MHGLGFLCLLTVTFLSYSSIQRYIFSSHTIGVLTELHDVYNNQSESLVYFIVLPASLFCQQSP